MLQAEEERKRAEEEAARKEAEELAMNPVLRLRKLISEGASPKAVVDDMKTIDAEGGAVGRIRILFEVSRHHLFHYSVFVSIAILLGLPAVPLAGRRCCIICRCME